MKEWIFVVETFRIKELISVYDPTYKMINSSSAESTNRAAALFLYYQNQNKGL